MYLPGGRRTETITGFPLVALIAFETCLKVFVGCRFTATISSPGRRPACAAGEFGETFSTRRDAPSGIPSM